MHLKDAFYRSVSNTKTDKREVSMGIDERGGRLNCLNKMGERACYSCC